MSGGAYGNSKPSPLTEGLREAKPLLRVLVSQIEIGAGAGSATHPTRVHGETATSRNVVAARVAHPIKANQLEQSDIKANQSHDVDP